MNRQQRQLTVVRALCLLSPPADQRTVLKLLDALHESHQRTTRAEYEGLIARKGGQRLKAVVAVSRSAIKLLFSIARDRQLFTLEPPGPRVHRHLSVPEA